MAGSAIPPCGRWFRLWTTPSGPTFGVAGTDDAVPTNAPKMHKPLLPVLSSIALLAGACQRDSAQWSEPRTVADENRPTQFGAPARSRFGLPEMGAAGAQAGAATQFTGEAPGAWRELPAQPNNFKDRVWQLGDDATTECYLTAGVRGGVAGNLARWYGQFGAAPAAVESLPVVEFAGQPGRLLELTGTYKGNQGWAMMLAFRAKGDVVTTLKFTGPEAAVKAHRDDFLGLAKVLRAASASPLPNVPPIERGQAMPSDHPPIAGDATHDMSPPPSPFTADVPAGWQPVPGSQRVLHHSFGDGGEVYVSQLGGGLRAMLDIWRGEVAAGPASDTEFAAVGKTPMLGAEAALLDVAGDFTSMSGKQIPGARILVAALDAGGSITFAKLVGKAADVEGQRAAFVKFCASLRRQP